MACVDPDNEETFEVCIFPSDLCEAVAPKQRILTELERCQFSDEDIFGIKLALEEALTNAVKHGNGNDPTKKVTLKFAITQQKAVIIVGDEGAGFLPEDVPDCTEMERLAIPNGRGIMLIRAYMDEVCYRDRGREIYFAKHRTTAGDSEGGQ
jgi:serine/threonine-protein kinase RsbW